MNDEIRKHYVRQYYKGNRHDLPGKRKFLPVGKEKTRSFPGFVVDTFLPNVEREPIFSLNNQGGLSIGHREPVDFATGQQMNVELKLSLNYWNIDKLQGRIFVCPVNGRDPELLQRMIEVAYTIESTVTTVKQRWREVTGVIGAVLSAV